MQFSFTRLALAIVSCVFISLDNPDALYLNTSNPGKLQEYLEYFSPRVVLSTSKDLREPQSDPLTIIRYKASCFQGVLVDDVSLDVEGVDIGVNIRWLLDNLNSPEYVGRPCVFSCLLAIRVEDVVKVYKGEVKGVLVQPRGEGYGLGPYFLPDGADKTLGEFMDPRFNARYIAIENFKADRCFARLPPLETWEGEFQGN